MELEKRLKKFAVGKIGDIARQYNRPIEEVKLFFEAQLVNLTMIDRKVTMEFPFAKSSKSWIYNCAMETVENYYVGLSSINRGFHSN